MKSKSHYFSLNYLKKERLLAYLDQIYTTLSFYSPSDTVLEIGKGNGFFSEVMKNYFQINVITLDHDPELKPDILADITSEDFSLPQKFSIITCFEVLEHIPFQRLVAVVERLRRNTRKVFIISVPDTNFFIQFRLNYLFFRLAPYNVLITIPRFFKNSQPIGKDHQWEIGIRNNNRIITPKILIDQIFGGRNCLIKHFRGREFPGHHFFVLKGES